jgi:autophagy-related protein 101
LLIRLALIFDSFDFWVMLLTVRADRSVLADCLQAIIHSILFHRVLVSTTPIDVAVPQLALTYVKLNIPEIDDQITHKIQGFLNQSESTQITVNLYDKKYKRSWFASKTEGCWEVQFLTQQWTINVEIKQNLKIASELSQTLLSISRSNNDKSPPLSTEPFPFEVFGLT